MAALVLVFRPAAADERRGAVATGLTTLVVAVAKFSEGAWITLAVIPALLLVMVGIRRILPAYDTLEQQIAEIEYPLTELKRYFDNDPASTLNERSARIFAFFVKQKIAELEIAAQDFDEEYAADAP